MTDLAALVAMRLTHDLAGPIGAISTGVGMLDGGDPEIRALVADGAAAAVASLRLHRFVLAPPQGDAANARGLLEAWVATRERLTLDWRVATTDAARVAIVAGLAMCAAEAASRGGALLVDDDGATLTSPTITLDPGVAAALTGGAVTVSRAALGGLLAAAAAAHGGWTTVASGEGSLRLGYQRRALPR